jgi:predicted DNA-binding transcriptional regulator YafY
MSTSTRLLRLLSLLQARRQWSGPELAERLGVTERTLRRDVDRLRQLGYPIGSTPGHHGGYRLGAGAALPPLLLGDDEAMAVTSALRSVVGDGGPGLQDAAMMALAKIEQVLPARLRTRMEGLDIATVRVGRDGPGGPVLDIELLLTVAHACRTPERLRFQYVDGSGRHSERHVEPYRLVHAGRWYLVARDRDREAWRTFRVDRMSDAVATGMRVRHHDPPDPAELVAEGTAVAAHRWHATVVIEAGIEQVDRYVAPTEGRLEAAGRSTRMRIGADDLDWIARYLARLPFRFTVETPAELRSAVVELADRLAADAGRPA